MAWRRRAGSEWVRPHAEEHAQTPRRRTAPLPVLLALNLVALGLIAGVVMRLRDDRVSTERELETLRSSARTAQLSAEGAIQRAEELAQNSTATLDARLQKLDTGAWRDSAQLLSNDLQRTTATTNAEINARLMADQSLEQRLKLLDEKMARVQAQSEALNIFSSIEERAAPCVYLLHCSFDYRVVNAPGSSIETGTGWGSGFMISADGYLATNKHVLQPWKFDPDLATMLAEKEIEIVGEPRVYAWGCGERCVSDTGTPLLGRAFSMTGKRRLRVAGFAPDMLRPVERDSSGRISEPPLHELDNNDLALLQLEGGPFPCLELSTPGRVHKLDRVMTIGFPRGARGLESGIAQTSPSLGTVRKAEDTIHITASIIPGNSGGPLMDERGQVVGVVTRIYSETLGICLRAELVRDLLGRVREPASGGAPAGNAVMSVPLSLYR